MSLQEYINKVDSNKLLLFVIIAIIAYMFYITLYDNFSNLLMGPLIGGEDNYKNDQKFSPQNLPGVICDTACRQQGTFPNLSLNACQEGGACPGTFTTGYARPGIESRLQYR